MQFSSSTILTTDNAPNPTKVKTWCDEIQQALCTLFETGTTSIDFPNLLHTQYLIVSNNSAAILYHQLSLEINNRVLSIKEKLNQIPPGKLMETLSATWKHFLYVIDSLRSFCPHLEQSFISPGQYFSLSDYALKRWHIYILSNTDILASISRAVIHAFNIAREGDGKLPTYITNMASMLSLIDPLSHSVSTFYIEDGYIQDISLVCGQRRTNLILASQKATEIYEKQLQQQQQDSTHEIETPKYTYVMDYCNQVEIWIAQELILCQQILSPATCQRIKTLLLEELIGQADAILIEDRFDGLLYHFQHHNIPQVSLLYHLLTLAQADVSVLIDEIKALIKEETTKIITEANKCQNPIIFVNAIYHLFQQYTQVIQQACYNNTDLLVATQNSIEYVICGSSSAPKLLALYIDQLLRASLQTISLTNTTFTSSSSSSSSTTTSTTTTTINQDYKNQHKNDKNHSDIQFQQASTYRNTLDPTLFSDKNRHLDDSIQFQSALQARHRIFYELDIHIQKWIDLVRFLSDKDIYEENHRLLCVDRLLLNIHQNFGYEGQNINLQHFSGLVGANNNNGQNILFQNAFNTATTQSLANSNPKQSALYELRHMNGIMDLSTIDSINTTKLYQFLSTHPDVPLFILLEYYLCGHLAAPNGPQIPIQQFEALLRDVTTSASLHRKYTKDPNIQSSIQEQWYNYLDSIGLNIADVNNDGQQTNTFQIHKLINTIGDNDINNNTNTTTTQKLSTTMNDESTTKLTINTTHFVPKTLYNISSIDPKQFPLFIPTVVTQGVWNNTISPTIPTVSTTFSKQQQLQQQDKNIISAQLLQTSHILYPTLKIPFEILTMLNIFQEKYTTSWYKGRKLIWNYSVSTAIIDASFKHPELKTIKTYELVCTYFQLLILHLFNYKEMYTYSEIADLTGIITPTQFEESVAQFNSALLSLSHPRVGILKKTPNTPQMDKTHQFSWNHSFHSSSQRFYIPKINATTMKNLSTLTSSTQGQSTTTGTSSSSISNLLSTSNSLSQKTLFRRETAVDAAIVRLLKQHKQLVHGDLISKVQEVLKPIFTPDESFIKQRIEQQIDQFNIERDSDERKLYRYF